MIQLISVIESAESEDIIIDSNPDFKERIVYCGICGVKMVSLGLKRYKCEKCELELKE